VRNHLLILPIIVLSALLLLVGLHAWGAEKNSMRLIVGGDDNYPPYEFLNDRGQPDGFNVDLMRAVGDVMGLEMDIRLGPWNEVRGELEAGRIDAVTGMSQSEERARLVDFSTPHAVTSYTIFVRRGSPIRSMEGVRGKEILVQKGDIMHDYVVEEGLSDRIIAVENPEIALRLLASGRHDCAILEKLQGLYNADKSKLSNIETVGPPIQPREFCFAVTEGNSDLLAKLNEGLRILYETGRYDEIHDKWFGAYEDGAFTREILKYALWILTPLILLLAGSFLWSRSLKKQVTVRTEELNQELAKRKRAEEAIRRRGAVLEAVSFAAERFLKTACWEENIQKLLERLGRAADVSRVYIFKNRTEEDGLLLTTQRYEWVAEGIEPQIDNQELQDLPWRAGGMGRWEETLSGGGVISGNVKEFPERERDILLPQDILSIVAVPIFSGREWWGFLGFDECMRERQWTAVEIDAIKAAAGILGAAIQRGRAEQIHRRLAEIARNASDGIILTDPEGRTLYVNPAFERMSGYTQGELMNRDPADLIADDDVAAIGDEIRSEVREKGEWTGELLCRRKSGEMYTVESRVFAIRNEEGDLVEIAAIQKDITERKRAEKVLIRYAQVCRSMEEALIICTCEGVVIDMNPAAERMFGWSREELVGRSAEIINPPEEARKIADDINRMLRQKGVWRGEIPLVTKSGERRTLLTVISCLRDKSGKWIGNIGINRDITERKRVEEALKKSEERLDLAVSGANLGLWDWNIRTGDIVFNRQWAEMLGYAVVELEPMANSWKNHVHPDDKPEMMKILDAHLEGKTPVYEAEFRMRTKSGGWKWILSTGKVFERDDTGKPLRMTGLHRDITHRKEAEEQILHAQKMEAIGTLAGGIAHDFNNILAGIMGYASLTERSLPESSPIMADMEAIARLSWRGADLTKALLAFARKGKSRPKVLKINSVVTDVLKVIGETVGKSAYIKRELSRALSNVFGDEGQIHQVIMNLCINACEAMPGGGTLTVETAVAELGDGFLALYPRLKKGDYVSVRFTDTGVGMDEETREHIFEPFFTTKAEKSGTGLGLSMVIGIVEGHGGCIEVESEPGKGSVFTVYLPGTEEAIEETPAKPAGAMRGGETILLVDDEADFRYGTGRWLEELGYKVIEAASGDEALEVLGGKRDEIDLVLLDMIMKGISGVETFQRMREIVPGLPIIICSGYSVDAATRQLLKKGACDFLQKPFDSNGLALKIREILDGC